MNIPITADGKDEGDTYYGDLDGGVEGFEVVKPNLLTDDLSDRRAL